MITYKHHDKSFILKEFNETQKSSTFSSPIMVNTGGWDGIGLLNFLLSIYESTASIIVNSEEATVIAHDISVTKNEREYCYLSCRLANLTDFVFSVGKLDRHIFNINMDVVKKGDELKIKLTSKVAHYSNELINKNLGSGKKRNPESFKFDVFDEGQFKPVFKNFVVEKITEFSVDNDESPKVGDYTIKEHLFEIIMKKAS